MGDRKWERFEEAAAKKWVKGGARVSVNPTGEITFDVGTYRAMGEPQAVFLNWEEKTETIGLEPGHADKANAVMVRARHARSNRVVRSTAFFKKHGILPATTLILPFAYLEGNVLILDLRTAVAWGSGWKRPKQAEARRVVSAEVRADREKRRDEIRAEKERLKAERHQLGLDRARLRTAERELEARARGREREIERLRRDARKVELPAEI